MPRPILVCVTLLASLGGASSLPAVDYFWQNSVGGAFFEFSNWTPTIPPGPGGANDTVNFDLGIAPSSRYLLPDVAGETDQLLVHNDSVELVIFIDYALVSAGGANPSLVVGAGSGDTADVIFSGASTSVLETQVTRIGNVAGSTGIITASGLQWNGGNLRVGYAGTGTLTIDDDAIIASTNVSIGHLSGSAGNLNFIGDGALSTTGNLLIGREGNGSLNLTFNGTVISANASIGSEPTGEGEAHVSGQFSAWTIEDTLTVGGAGDAELVMTDGSITNTHAVVGDLPASDGFVFVSGGEWTTTGRLTVGGETVGGTSGGSGLFRISSGEVTVEEEIVISPNGVVDFQGGLLVAEQITLQAGGQFDWTGGLLDVDQFNGDLVNQGGVLLPEQNTTINGTYTQEAGSMFAISIVGEAANDLFDSVDVTGTAFLGGDFDIARNTLYEPSPSEVYTVLRAGNIVGSFDNVVSGERLAGGRGSYVVYYGPGSPFDPSQVILTDFQPAPLPGDYNDNGVVDAADFVVWRDNEGTSNVLPNDPIGGMIGPAQYDQWRAHFGQNAGVGAASRAAQSLPRVGELTAAVPEPSKIAQLCLTMLAVLRARLRHEVAPA